jgi:hypothetical protein
MWDSVLLGAIDLTPRLSYGRVDSTERCRGLYEGHATMWDYALLGANDLTPRLTYSSVDYSETV